MSTEYERVPEEKDELLHEFLHDKFKKRLFGLMRGKKYVILAKSDLLAHMHATSVGTLDRLCMKFKEKFGYAIFWFAFRFKTKTTEELHFAFYPARERLRFFVYLQSSRYIYLADELVVAVFVPIYDREGPLRRAILQS